MSPITPKLRCLTSAVRGTAARLRFLLNLKRYGVGGGPRRRALLRHEVASCTTEHGKKP
jgi:hypothetical protein